MTFLDGDEGMDFQHCESNEDMEFQHFDSNENMVMQHSISNEVMNFKHSKSATIKSVARGMRSIPPKEPQKPDQTNPLFYCYLE